MTRQTLIKVDLGQARDEQAEQFRDEMESRGWSSDPETPSIFWADVDPHSSDSDIIDVCEEDATWSAEMARVYEWDAVCIINDQEQHSG